jgi:TonB family protein
MPVNSMRKSFSVFFLCCTSFFCVAAQQALTPSQLADQANAISDLSKLGSYELKAIVAVGDEKHGATGTLTVDHDQENTRQELEFTDYHEISLVNGNMHYYQREPKVQVHAAERIHGFDELWQVSIPPGSDVGAISSAKVHGVQALCFAAQPDKFTHLRYCFEAATHLLLSRKNDEKGETFEALFLDYQEVDGVHFPGTIRFIEPERVATEVRKVAAVKMPFAPAHFAPPPGLRGFHSCRGVQAARLVKRVEPEYPIVAREKHIQGDVRLLVRIGSDGKVQEVTRISGHPLLMVAAIDAVKKWEYKPALCSSGPAESEGDVMVQFHMGATVGTRSDSGASARQAGTRPGIEAR